MVAPPAVWEQRVVPQLEEVQVVPEEMPDLVAPLVPLEILVVQEVRVLQVLREIMVIPDQPALQVQQLGLVEQHQLVGLTKTAQ